MIRKSYFLSISWRTIVVMMLLLLPLSGCMDTYEPDQGTSSAAVLNIRVTPSTEVNFRSERDLRDTAIDNLYILRFDAEGKFVKGEEVENASGLPANPTITLKETPTQGETLIVIANVYRVNLSNLTVGASTVSDISSAFPGNITQGDWHIKTEHIAGGTLSIPMSGELTWTASGSREVQLKRSVARVKLVINIPEGADATGSLSGADPQDIQWKILDIPDEGDIYRPAGAALTDGYAGVVDYVTLSANNIAFIPETNNFSNIDTDIRGEQRRPSIIIKYKVKTAEATPGQEKFRYYRMDFNDRHYISRSGAPAPTLTYQPIQRNNAYTFTVTSAKSHGYETEDEAMSNPPTNILYKMVVTANNQSSLTHTGQYLISASWENLLIIYLPQDRYFDMDMAGTTNYYYRSVSAGFVDIKGPDDTKDIKASIRAYEVTDDLLHDVHKLSTYDRVNLKRIDENNPEYSSPDDGGDTPEPPSPGPSPKPKPKPKPRPNPIPGNSGSTPFGAAFKISPLQDFPMPIDDEGGEPVFRLPKEDTRFIWSGYDSKDAISKGDFIKSAGYDRPMGLFFYYWPEMTEKKPADVRAVFKIDAGNARKIMNVSARNYYASEVVNLPDREIIRIKGLYPPFLWVERPQVIGESSFPIDFVIVKVEEPDVYSIRIKSPDYYYPYPMTAVLSVYYKPPTSGVTPGMEHFMEGVTYINFVMPANPAV